MKDIRARIIFFLLFGLISLETVDGVVIFDENHNTQRFEHMIMEHLPESLTLEVEE